MNTWDDMKRAINDAKTIIRTADGYAADMARIIVGHLRSCRVSADTLSTLKRELRDWDMHRATWKDKK